jgi:Zn-dependent M16 (insulinase) family peptidase
MNFQINQEYSGFLLNEITDLTEIKAKGYLLSHQKTGLKLFFMETDDDNKVFSIAFKTPPPDSTGLPHILEHSVLCGSRKFPAKDPFMELAKGSLNTFLNAMTGADNTSYPFASRNNQDFHNLMDVYLDAVFFPKLLGDPRILKQEGWHYHLEDQKDELTVQGVVYNEMKGAYSSPESILYKKVTESLFPDNYYGLDSGGDPEVIPTLTQEDFVAFHKKYYHPSNAFVVIYGNGVLSEYLEFIDTAYLSSFEEITVDQSVVYQKPFENRLEEKHPYPVSPDEDVSDKNYFSLNFAVDMAGDPTLFYALEILAYLLIDSPSGLLKKEMLDQGIGSDILSITDNSIPQPIFGIAAKHVSADKKDLFLKVAMEKLREFALKGIPKKSIEAAINHFEFGLREAEFHGFPKGLYYIFVMVTNGWLNLNSPSVYLAYDPLLVKIRTALTEPYFERIIQKYLLNNYHSTLIELYPSQSYSREKEALKAEELSTLKKSMSQDQLLDLVAQTEALLAHQREEDTPEVLGMIPQLELSDISDKSDTFPLTLHETCGIKTLHHETVTNGISYLKLLFPLEVVTQEMLPYCSLLSDVLGSMDTSTHNYEDLTNEVNIQMGDLSFDAIVYSRFDNSKDYLPKFVISTRYLSGSTTKALALIREIIFSTRFTSKKRLKELMMEVKSSFEMRLFDNGNSFAMMRLFSYFSPSGYLTEAWNGIAYYIWLSERLKNFDHEADEILTNLEKTLHKIVRKPGMIVSLTSSIDDYGYFVDRCPILMEDLPCESLAENTYTFDLKPKTEALLTQANVQYNAMGYDYADLCGTYSGYWQVAHSILSLDYLYNQIRVQGGAYGAGSKMTRNGLMGFWSYRDPKVEATFDVYKGAGDYLARFDVSPREMTKYIIGTIASVDYPLTAPKLGEKALSFYLTGMTWEKIQKERDEILSTKPADIRACAELVAKVTSQKCWCSLGNEKLLKDNMSLFSVMTQVNQ